MWINKEVEIPEPLISAQREGRLVIFAGAGISMGSPSNLPNFASLAKRITGQNLSEEDKDRLDRFLGRAEGAGTNIQKRARDILSPETSQPTPLHYALVKLFDRTEDLRIVTTNFDRHFTTVLYESSFKSDGIYYAPALPLGRDFRGLVYLHGSVDRRDPLVLTDGDFGRAYLTEGWATRFLMGVFQNYSVLFVGYSYQDPVMHYLARGFIAHSERFALESGTGKAGHWTHYGITPISYPLRPSPEIHGALVDAIEAWAKRSRLGILDHENRILKIVQSPPPLDFETLDYLDQVINETALLRYFVKYAKITEWLDWIEEKGTLDQLFTVDQLSDESSRLLAYWFARGFAVDHANRALDLVRRKGLMLNPVLWDALAMELARREPRPSAEVLMRWVLILTNSPAFGQNHLFLGLILTGCAAPEDQNLAILLFSYLARPTIKLEQSWRTQGERMDLPRLEITIRGNDRVLQQAWAQFFQPRMSELHKELLPLLIAFLGEIELAVKSWEDLHLSYRRKAIEEHEQNWHKEDWEFLLDTARNLLEWLLENEVEVGEKIIQEWSKHNSLLRNRLAIHGLAESKALSPDIALARIEQEGWLFRRTMKHEVFRLVKRVFASASDQAQKQFIEHSMEAGVLNRENGTSQSAEDQRISDYERYNVAVWLHRVAPESLLAQAHLEQVQKEHQEFEPRDHPDFDVWSGGFESVGSQSPISKEKLLENDPIEHLKLLLSYSPTGARWDGPDRVGLLAAVQHAVAERFEWAWELANLLVYEEEWTADLWGAILGGWNDSSELTEEQKNKVLDLLSEYPELNLASGMDILRLLKSWLDSSQGGPTSSQLDQVESLADRIFEASKATSDKELSVEKGWLLLAINHIGGQTANVWLEVLSRRRAGTRDQWSGLPDGYRSRFEKVTVGDDLSSQYARIVLASEIDFLFTLDEEWTKRHILWFFDWERDSLTAEQVWDGFLIWGRWHEASFSAMLPYIGQLFSHLDDVLPERRQRLCDMLGLVAAYSTIDPWPEAWLAQFIKESGPETRENWAARFGGHLQTLSDDGKSYVWRRWLHQYWSDRSTGIPVPISDKEREQMILWSIGLEPELDAVVRIILAQPAPSRLEHGTLYRLSESGIAGRRSHLVASLLNFMLSNLEELPYDGFEAAPKMVLEALEGGALQKDLLGIADSLGRLGYMEAQELRKRIEGSG